MRLRLAPPEFREAALSVVVGATAAVDVPKRCFPEPLPRTPKASPMSLRERVICTPLFSLARGASFPQVSRFRSHTAEKRATEATAPP